MNDFDTALTRLVHPSHEFSPAPIWWWSGDTLDSARLRWQLERFAEGGVYNLVILNLAPAGPLHGSLADDPPFLSAAWWAIFVQVCRDAKQLGISLWFYDQIGFSGANLQGQIIREHPEYAGQMLGSQMVACTTATTISFPNGCQPLGAWQYNDTHMPESLVIADSQVSSTLNSTHTVRLVYAISKGFDYLSHAACAALRGVVHEAFQREAGQYFGDVIVGSFQDELPSMPTWSHDFAASFRTAFGYDITQELIALYQGTDERSAQIRIDYQQWRAHRAEMAFFKPFYDWHAAHGLLCGFDQQSPARMALPVGAVDEYADYIQTHRWYGAPGSDHHGNGKIHSSMAHLYGHPRSWIEAFHSSGWGGTLEETFDWLVPWLRAGLTLYDPHAVYYSTKGGWWEWAPPSTCWRQPYWRHYRHFADVVMRVMGILATGTHQCDFAVLFPTTTVQANLLASGPLPAASRAEAAFVEITGSMFWNNPKPGLLDQCQHDFDMIDNDSLLRATMHDAGMHVAGETYRYIILPAVTHLPAACVAQLNAFMAHGGTVFAVHCVPSGLVQHQNLRIVDSVAALTPFLNHIPLAISGDVHTLVRRVDGGRIVLVTPTKSGTAFHWNGHWNSTPYDFDATRVPHTVHVSVPHTSVVELWRLTDGVRMACRRVRDDIWEVPLDDAPVAIIYIPDTPLPTTLSSPHSHHYAHELPLAHAWNTRIVPTVDNRWGDLSYPTSDLLLPQTMRFVDESGHEHVQGFGVYAWSVGPMPRDTQLAPLTDVQPGDDPLGIAGWQPVVYSQSRGIRNDTIHWGMLGPKGYVPEEFMHFGEVSAHEFVRVRTTVTIAAPFVGSFVVAAAAAKIVWLDGVKYSDCVPGYQWFIPVNWTAGMHLIEFELAPEQPVNLRAYWALVHDERLFRRPNWIMQVDQPQAATTIVFQHEFELTEAAHMGQMMVIADVPVRVLLDHKEIGRQGGYDPYGTTVRVQPYELASLLSGQHTISIEALDGGRGVSILVDAIFHHQHNATMVMSGEGWTVARHQISQPARIRRRQWVDLTYDTDRALYVDMDPGWPLIWRRQHPLPHAHWLESSPADGNVLACRPDAYAGRPRTATLTWRIPVGATAMRIAAAAPSDIYIDGVKCGIHNGLVLVPQHAAQATLQICAHSGGAGAALLDAPITYTWSVGASTFPATWQTLGYADYAGAVEFDSTFTWDREGTRVAIVLPKVRGSVEVWLNGALLGVRVWSPYQFDATREIVRGQNHLRILVTSTLAPYLATHSPTHYAPAYQEVAGILDQVKLCYS